MNINKIKWLYRKDKNRYHCFYPYWWEEVDEELDEEDYWNLNYFRRKSGYRNILRINDICKEFGVKGYTSEKTCVLNPWEDYPVQSRKEKKSWKRNSKRKHQWKIDDK